MKVYLYNSTATPDIIDKTNYLGTPYIRQAVYFKQPENIENVSLLLDRFTNFNDYNYIYIEELNKYYFITSRIIVDNNRFIINGEEDVLYTFKSKILNQNSTAYIRRSYKNGSKNIYDEKVSFEYNTKEEMQYSLIPSFISQVSLLSSSATFVMLVFMDADQNGANMGTENLPSGYVPYTTQSNKSRSGLDLSTAYRLLTIDDFKIFAKQVYNNDILMGYIKACYIYPFEVDIANAGNPPETYNGKTQVTVVNDHLYLGDTEIQVKNYQLRYYQIQYPCYHYKYTKSDVAFYDYDPHTKYAVWVYGLGWVEVPANRFLNRQLLIYYNLDLETGNVAVCFRNTESTQEYPDDKVFKIENCELCVPINLSKTNKLEADNQRNANVRSTILSTITGAITTFGGIASGNPLITAGGVMAMTGAVVSGVNRSAQIYDTAQSRPTSSAVSATEQRSAKNLYILISRQNPILPDYTKIGYPYCRYATPYNENGYFEALNFRCDASGMTSLEYEEIQRKLERGVFTS